MGVPDNSFLLSNTVSESQFKAGFTEVLEFLRDTDAKTTQLTANSISQQQKNDLLTFLVGQLQNDFRNLTVPVAQTNSWYDFLILLANGRTQRDKNYDFINVADYGAKTTLADNTAAINAAALKASQVGGILYFTDFYICTGNVNIPDNVVVMGSSRRNAGLTSSAGTTIITGEHTSFYNLKIFNSNALHICISTDNKNAPYMNNCFMNGRFRAVNNTTSELRAPNFDHCVWTVDFGSDYNGVDQMDLFNIYGYFGASWQSCIVNVANVHRIWKLTDNINTALGTKPSLNNTRAVTIDNCKIRGYGGKQVIDTYFGSSAIHFTNNHLELPDTATLSGNKFSIVLENKTEADERDIGDVGAAIVFSGNTGYTACNLIAAQGNYGITQSGYNATRCNTLKIFGNDMRRITDSTDAYVQSRFYNHVHMDGNTFAIPRVTNRAVVELASNESVTIGDGEVYSGGNILLTTKTTNSAAQTFTGKAGDLTIGAARVTNFDADAALRLVSLDATYVAIYGLKSRPAATVTALCRSLYATATVSLGKLIMKDIDATHPTGGLVIPVLGSVDTDAIAVYRDCSWQPKLRGYASTIPTTGTYLRGDTLRHSAPNLGTVTEWTCILGGTPGTWKASSWITNKGATSARPTLTANDFGVTYLDTTLAAAGKPITWNGTAWVDATGATV